MHVPWCRGSAARNPLCGNEGAKPQRPVHADKRSPRHPLQGEAQGPPNAQREGNDAITEHRVTTLRSMNGVLGYIIPIIQRCAKKKCNLYE